MHLSKTLRLAACLLGGLLVQTATAQAPRQYTIEQFMKTIRFGGSTLSPDEQTVLFSSNQDGVFNLYEIPFAGGTPKQLTFSKTNAIFVLDYLPDGRILYSSDQGGNELTHIYLREKDGAVTDLTPADKAEARPAKFTYMDLSHDRKSFFYGSNARNRAATDVYLYDNTTRQTALLTKHEGEVSNGAAGFTPDGRKLLISTDAGSEFSYVTAYDLSSGKSDVLDKANWDIQGDYYSHKGRYRVVSINEDAHTALKLIDTKTGQAVQLPALPAGDVTGVHLGDSEGRMLFYINSSQSPSTLYSYEFSTKKVTPLVRGLNPEINPGDLVAGEVIRYKSFDGLEIPALLYKPKDASATNKRPAMLVIHGGPGGQTRLNYNPLTQYLVNHGYVLLAVNNRGSSGYGKTFFAADDRKHGDADLRDCVESKQFLTKTGYVVPDKIGIMGGSYGGYMTLAGLTFTPDAFAVGVDIFGVANWLRTLNSMPDWWGPQREALFKEIGNPKTDSVALYNKSPLFHTQRIKKPLLVIQGANDPRVLKIESDEIVANVKKNGVPVEYVTFPDEGHGFLRKENEITAYKAIREFLNKYLLGSPTAAR